MSFCAALSVEEDEAEIIKRNGDATQSAASGGDSRKVHVTKIKPQVRKGQGSVFSLSMETIPISSWKTESRKMRTETLDIKAIPRIGAS